MPETFYKRCSSCFEYFEAKPLEFKFYCNKLKCKKVEKYKIEVFKRSRNIPLTYFDIYFKEDDKYVRGCRICGSDLLNKNGKRSSYRRYCIKHNANQLYPKCSWQFIQYEYIENLQNKQILKILERLGTLLNNQELVKTYKFRFYFILCEECNSLTNRYNYWYSNKVVQDKTWKELYKNQKSINVHHKIPVHTLTKENFRLIWDKTNLIALCSTCHGIYHRKKNLEVKYQEYRKITEYI